MDKKTLQKTDEADWLASQPQMVARGIALQLCSPALPQLREGPENGFTA
jgi:hypothetical protein